MTFLYSMDENTRERLGRVERLLTQCEEDLNVLKEIKEKLISIENNRKALDDYYKCEYMNDRTETKDSSSHYRFRDEDSIWNVLQSQYEEKINLIKILTKSI